MTTSPTAEPTPRFADLVLEGGGVRGLGLVGAVDALAGAGYTFPRVAGTSVGAVVGSVVAAIGRAGRPLSELTEVAATLQPSKFRDSSTLDRLLGPLGPLAGLILEDGLYEGEYLRQWVAGVLKDYGVVTFGDLALAPDPESTLRPEQRYRLVVTASDLSRRQFVRFPWDYAEYGVDPDEQKVADAVRASAAIPLFFEPSTLAGRTLVDGGLLSNFPVALFDRTDSRAPRWPTFGVRLSSDPGKTAPVPSDDAQVRGPLGVVVASVATVLAGSDSRYISDPCVVSRTVFADAGDVSPVDFGLSAPRRAALVASGRNAAQEFLAGWDFDAWKATCR